MYSAMKIECRFENVHKGVKITQLGALDQFDNLWLSATEEFSTSNFICGYTTIAYVRLLRALLEGAPDRALTKEEILSVCDKVSAMPNIVLTEVKRAMKKINEQRTEYISNHPTEFPTRISKNNYIKALVASYEISDELRSSLDLLSPFKSFWNSNGSSLRPSAHFARENEFPQLEIAANEEKTRIKQEQSRFGGTIDLYGVSHIDTDKGESGFIFERFKESPLAELDLLTPTEWESLEKPTIHKPKVWALHIEGHYVAGFSCNVQEATGNVSQLFTLNTVNQNNTTQPIITTLLETYSKSHNIS